MARGRESQWVPRCHPEPGRVQNLQGWGEAGGGKGEGGRGRGEGGRRDSPCPRWPGHTSWATGLCPAPVFWELEASDQVGRDTTRPTWSRKCRCQCAHRKEKEKEKEAVGGSGSEGQGGGLTVFKYLRGCQGGKEEPCSGPSGSLYLQKSLSGPVPARGVPK